MKGTFAVSLLFSGSKLTQCPTNCVLPLNDCPAAGRPKTNSSCPVCLYKKTSNAAIRVTTKLAPDLIPTFFKSDTRLLSIPKSKRLLLKVLSCGLGKSVGSETTGTDDSYCFSQYCSVFIFSSLSINSCSSSA